MKYQAIDSEYIREMKERDEFLREKKWMLKGVKYGYFIALLIIILSAFFNGNLVLAVPNDIEYTFENNEIYNEENPIPDLTFNTRNQTEYTEIYNATYSFTNDADASNPAGFNIIEGTACTVNVISNLDGHDKVLELFDTTNGVGDWALVQNEFTPRDEGTVEMWVRFDGTTDNRYFYAYNDITKTIGAFFWVTSGVNFYDANSNVLFAYDMDVWYHVKVWFDCDADIYSLWVNGLQYVNGDSIPTGFEISGIGMIQLNTKETDSGNDYWFYIDAIGFDWDIDYSLNDNLIPYFTTNNTLEVENWGFANNEDSTVTTHLQENIPFWTETGDDTDVYIKMDNDNCVDNFGVVLYIDDAGSRGIEREFSETTYDILEVKFIVDNEVLDPGRKVYEYFDIYSDDSTLVVRVRIDDNAIQGDFRLSYYDGVAYNQLEDISDLAEITYVLNITIVSNLVRLLVNDSTYYFPIITENKDGLSKVHIHGDLSLAGVGILLIDSIGVYIDGVSISNDYSSYYYLLDTPYNSRVNNLFFLNATGFFGASILNLGISGGTTALLSYQNTTGISLRNTCFATLWETSQEPYIVLSSNLSFTIYSMKLEGVSLTDGVIDYVPTYLLGSIDNNESYFYVDSSNLYFTMTTNDSELEYMEISFDVDNVFASNRSLKWSGRKSASSLEAQFKVNYVDSSYNPFTLEPDYKDLAVLLPRTKTIDSFGLLISDNDNDVNDTITGYLGAFDLLYVPLIETDFVSISFFDALPIVVLVVVIPIALYVGFGRKKELLIPSIIAMSIFGTAVGLIPLWLTFIIGFGCVSALIIQSRSG